MNMKRLVVAACFAVVTAWSATSSAASIERVVLQTNKGAIEIELFTDRAPVTVANFLKYVDAGYYNGLVFHRVIDGFMIQGGGYDADLKARAPNAPIVNESKNGLHNIVGAVAMARTNAPDSATSQFYINVADNPDLDFKTGHPGYCVFGKVVSGTDVVEAIASVRTTFKGGMQDVPIDPVVIESAKRVAPQSP
jgi:cyclophilin family peptidyl-prolyl cis-trans isomerase